MLNRRLVLGLVAALFALTVLGGALEIAAEPSSATGFQWGPAASPEEMPPPLNDMRVIAAIDSAVDEDSISARLLGQPSPLIFVEDATQLQDIYGGSNLFDVEAARWLLEEAGVTSLTLTLATDPAFPEAAALADAIATDLRSNIGAQVTVVEGPAEFIVTEAMFVPTPIPLATIAPGALVFEHTCTPDTFRPDEWVVIECVARSTNQGQDTLINIAWSVGGTFSGTIPAYFFAWSERDGEFQPVGTGGLGFGGYDVSPGQTVETRTVLLLRMSEGTFETEADYPLGGREVMTEPIRFVARADAADPPRDLLVTNELVGGPAGDEAVPTATYETKITNRGSSVATQLVVTERYGEYLTFVSGEPAPSTQNPAVQLASWDLAAFGKNTLAPGESLVVGTTYGSAPDAGCGYVMPGVVVEATVDGQEQRYGARAEDTFVRIEPCLADEASGGGGATSLVDGGEGPAAAEGDVVWLAFVLAGLGGALVAAALALPRPPAPHVPQMAVAQSRSRSEPPNWLPEQDSNLQPSG